MSLFHKSKLRIVVKNFTYFYWRHVIFIVQLLDDVIQPYNPVIFKVLLLASGTR
jgi:hypothetical protein